MTNFICETCGTEHPASAEPPARCLICEDERQYVGWGGQRWTTHEALARRASVRVGDDEGVLALEVDGFAIGQRAALLPTDAGNLMWESLSLVTDDALEALRARGGVDKIVVSHPHFYAAMVRWSEALGGVPIWIHEADRAWVQRPSDAIHFWKGDRVSLSSDVTLIRAGGHFGGSTMLHWASGPRPGGALFSGDAMQVVPTRRHVSFMYSYPNLIPMRASSVLAMHRRLSGLAFEDVYGYEWGRNIIGGGRAAVDASMRRYLSAMGAASGAPRRILVLGAAGQVGRAVAAEAERRGHSVTGAVRPGSDPARLPDGVTPLALDARDLAGVAAAIAAHDIVLLGWRPSSGSPQQQNEMVALTRSALDGAAASQRRVLVAGGAANLLLADGSGHTLLSHPTMLPPEMRPIAAASMAQYLACTEHPDADWVYASPPAELVPGTGSGGYRRGTDTWLTDAQGRSAVALGDYARALVDEIEQPAGSRSRFVVVGV